MLSSVLESAYTMFLIWLVLLLAPKAAVTPGLGEGYWHTRGAQMLDSVNRPVRIAGINWYGFETSKASPGGLNVQDYRNILQTIHNNGYNTVRIPLSNQMVETPTIPTDIKFSNRSGPINADLRGLNSLEILDKIIASAGSQGLKVILDNHRSEAGDGPESTGLWFTQGFPESAWIADWQMLTRRYANNPTVLGFDLRNEPHNANAGGSCWGCGGTNDWRFGAERAGNAILAINPRLLIFVEGVDAYENDFYWWGGNLMGVRTSPVRLAVPHQLVYSAHDYGPTESGQPWFSNTMTEGSLDAVWNKHWGYITKQGIAPVWLGEFGVEIKPDDANPPSPVQTMEIIWFQSMVNLLNRETQIGWTYWSLNGGDRNGLLNDNYDAVKSGFRQEALTTIQAPFAIRAGKAVSESVIEPVKPSPRVIPLAHAKSRETEPASANAETPSYPAPSYPAPSYPAQTSQAPSHQPPSHQPPSDQPPDTQAPEPNIGCKVTYTVLNDWQSGYTAGIVIQNTGTAPINAWRLTWSFDGNQKITQLWNGRLTQKGGSITLLNESWNASIPLGGNQAGVGFNAEYSRNNLVPVRFYLNGTLCK
jgi:endoglucanase